MVAGFSAENVVLGMLEKKDYDSIDFVSPFFEEIVEVCCR